jgi:phosphoesterase RecJ-like protein
MQAIKEKIENANSIIIIAHVRPDGDCIGSAEGLRHSIIHRFPQKQVFCRYESLDSLAFLGTPDDVEDESFASSLVISVDTANQERIYDQRYRFANELVRIDHHPHVDHFGDVDYVDTTSPSTCNIITRLLQEWAYEIPQAAAKALLIGMTTDTGRFRYRGVTSQTFEQAAVLLQTGIDIATVYQPLYETTLNELQFLGYFLTKIQRSDGGILYIVLTQKDIQTYNLKDETAADFISHLSDVKDFSIWFLVYETKDGDWRVRLRSSHLEIHQVAALYQGGGHPLASGFQLTSLEQLPSLIKDLEAVLRKGQ